MKREMKEKQQVVVDHNPKQDTQAPERKHLQRKKETRHTHIWKGKEKDVSMGVRKCVKSIG
jgi:hypothetical protein